jgi:hypothetical protein
LGSRLIIISKTFGAHDCVIARALIAGISLIPCVCAVIVPVFNHFQFRDLLLDRLPAAGSVYIRVPEQSTQYHCKLECKVSLRMTEAPRSSSKLKAKNHEFDATAGSKKSLDIAIILTLIYERQLDLI